ncbi:hypothetical protein IBX73_04075 [candidate division WOR-3 bacterium]|nr:hypothetical protein [candidate division WOR-3 bacterium]
MGVTLIGASGATYRFEGPFDNLDDLAEAAGVYAVLCMRAGKIDLVDVRESARVRTGVENNDRSECWKQHCLGILKYAVYYEDGAGKQSGTNVMNDIIANYYLICGG